MKTIRLLPIVIFAATALLFFKGVGLLTNGGYVLIGVTTAVAEGGGDHGGDAASEGAVTGADGTAAMTEHNMTDAAPTASDGAPTLPLGEQPVAAGHGATPGEQAVEGEAAATEAATAEHDAPAADAACVPADELAAAAAEAEAAGGGHGAEVPAGVPCEPPLVTADGDAIALVMGADGKLVPFSTKEGSESAVLDRLGERRSELDQREQELAMRTAVVEAAEKRINERTALLEQLQASIDSLVDQNKAAEEEQFKGVISMYENMKPKEAATILNELDLNTLLRVAKAINPRKMSPILAKMNPIKAKDLTAVMAAEKIEPTVAVTAENIAALPQIVGQ